MNSSRRQAGFSAIELIFGVVALAAIGAAVYFAYQNHDKVASTSPTPTPSTAKTADATQGWATYRSTQEPTLTFKYPTDWTIKPNQTLGENADSVTITSPSGTQLTWNSELQGVGGGCSDDTPHAKFTEVKPSAVAGVYGVTFTASGHTMLAVAEKDALGKTPKVGDVGSCLYYPTLTSRVDSERMLMLESQDPKSGDVSTVKLILQSLKLGTLPSR